MKKQPITPDPWNRSEAQRRPASRWAAPAAVCRRASGSISNRPTPLHATRFISPSMPNSSLHEISTLGVGVVIVDSAAADRRTFLKRPELGTAARRAVASTRLRAIADPNATTRPGDHRQRRTFRARRPSTGPARPGSTAAKACSATVGGSRRSSSRDSVASLSKMKLASCSERSWR